jgi:agmatinase
MDLEDMKIADIGDVNIFYGNASKTLDNVYITVKKIINDENIPLMIGGEHLISYPSVRATFEKYPDLRVIHFDAHTDYRDTFFDEKLSHATVMRRIHDELGDKRIYSFGIRSGQKEEFEFAKTHQYLEQLDVITLDKIIEEVSKYPIYVTLDLDILDPAYMPGTGTQEAGGLTFKELLSALLKLKALNIVGLDMVELSPDYDPSGASTATATKLVRELLLLTK